jgi:predicted nucleotidyltransferase
MIDITPDQQALVNRIVLEIVGDTEILYFGSRVCGKARPSSDLDIALKGDDKIPLSTMFKLMDAFEFSDLTFRVDAVDWHRLSPEFQRIIEQSSQANQSEESKENH